MLSEIKKVQFLFKSAISVFFLKMKIEFLETGHSLNHST